MVDEPLAVAAVRPPLVTELRAHERRPAAVLAAPRLGTTVARVRHVSGSTHSPTHSLTDSFIG